MSAKPLPPGRPPGSLDLLGPESNPSPRDRESAEDWRADALGRSRHSRLASELREPLDDADPERAEQLCAEVTRNTLGDFAPALLLLSADRRRRLQALTSWTVTLFDFALRPGLAGLDGDRLAQINAWEFRTEEALDGNPPGQPVFVMMALEERARPWSREALDEIGAVARRMALASQPERRAASSATGVRESTGPTGLAATAYLARALVTALAATLVDGESAEPPESIEPIEREDGQAAGALADLVGVAIATTHALQSAGVSTTERAALRAALEAVRVAETPRGWRRAAGYARRVLRARLRSTGSIANLGLASRLRLLALSLFR